MPSYSNIPAHIDGIPCLVDIYHQPHEPAIYEQWTGWVQPEVPEEIIIEEVKDRQGRLAPWLAHKLSDNQQNVTLETP